MKIRGIFSPQRETGQGWGRGREAGRGQGRQYTPVLDPPRCHPYICIIFLIPTLTSPPFGSLPFLGAFSLSFLPIPLFVDQEISVNPTHQHNIVDLKNSLHFLHKTNQC